MTRTQSAAMVVIGIIALAAFVQVVGLQRRMVAPMQKQKTTLM